MNYEISHTHSKERGREVIVEDFNYQRIGQDYIKWEEVRLDLVQSRFLINTYINLKRKEGIPDLQLNNI